MTHMICVKYTMIPSTSTMAPFLMGAIRRSIQMETELLILEIPAQALMTSSIWIMIRSPMDVIY